MIQPPGERPPDPAGSRAVLIGVSAYTELPPLPAVARSTGDLELQLTDREVWGIAPEHVVRLEDGEADRQAVLKAVHEAAEQAAAALVVYFSGHGFLVGPDAQLYLATTHATAQRPYISVRFADLAQIVRDYCAARLKVVILDCCFSGQAIASMGGGSPVPVTAIDGVCVITACAETELTYSPPGELYTVFAGELISVLRSGIDAEPELLTPRHLWREITRRLRARGMAQSPQLHGRNAGESAALVRNRAYQPVGAKHGIAERTDFGAFIDAMGRARSLDHIVTAAVREARAVLGTEAVLVVQRKPDCRVWRVAGEDPPRPRSGEAGDELFPRWGDRESDSRSTWTYDLGDSGCGPDQSALLHGRGLVRALAAPIRVADGPWGELLAARSAAAPEFSSRTADAIAHLAGILAMTIGKARELRRLQPDERGKRAAARQQDEFELLRDLWFAAGPGGGDGDSEGEGAPSTR